MDRTVAQKVGSDKLSTKTSPAVGSAVHDTSADQRDHAFPEPSDIVPVLRGSQKSSASLCHVPFTVVRHNTILYKPSE